MGPLQERVNLSQKVYGTDIVDFFKKNSIYMVDKYSKTDEMCEAIPLSDISMGRFYFFHYEDPSNWMRYSPVFTIEYKQLKDFKIIIGLNFNFIPLEIRSSLFDKFISEKMFESNSALEVNFQGIYTELLRYGFEYAIVEYNAIQLKMAHRINLELLPRFLYSSHPKNTYDPNKLMQIWTAKLETRKERHNEIITSTLLDFYEANSLINNKYDVLLGHVKRLQESYDKFKNK
jgi:hypothetical protein